MSTSIGTFSRSGAPAAFLLPPAFPGTPATVACRGAPEEKAAAGMQLIKQHQLRVRFNGIANPCIRRVLDTAGFRRTSGSRWNLLWGSPLKKELYKGMDRFQRCNHFPGTWELGRKDTLYKCAHIECSRVSHVCE